MNLIGHTCMQDYEVSIQVSKTWFEIKEKILNLKFKPHNTYNTNQTCHYMVRYCLNIIDATVTLGLSQPSPLTEILTRDLGGVVLTGTANSHTFPHYDNTKSE
jgi:hypothetical protein